MAKTGVVPASDLEGGFSAEVHHRASKMGLTGKVSRDAYERVQELIKLEADMHYNIGLISALQERVDYANERISALRLHLAVAGGNDG